MTEVAGLRRQRELPLSQLGKKQVSAFCSALKVKLQDGGLNFGKEYLKLLVEEIRVDKKEVRLSGSYAALAGALSMSTKPRQLPGVPSFVPVFPGRDTQQNFFVHQFGFLMDPMKKNHPRTEYMFIRLGASTPLLSP